MPGIEDPAAAIEEPDVVRAGVTVGQAVVTRFVRQRRKLADPGSGGYGGQAQRDGRAEEGVLAPGHGVRPGRGPEAGTLGRPMLHACIDPSAPA